PDSLGAVKDELIRGEVTDEYPAQTRPAVRRPRRVRTVTKGPGYRGPPCRVCAGDRWRSHRLDCTERPALLRLAVLPSAAQHRMADGAAGQVAGPRVAGFDGAHGAGLAWVGQVLPGGGVRCSRARVRKARAAGGLVAGRQTRRMRRSRVGWVRPSWIS